MTLLDLLQGHKAERFVFFTEWRRFQLDFPEYDAFVSIEKSDMKLKLTKLSTPTAVK